MVDKLQFITEWEDIAIFLILCSDLAFGGKSIESRDVA